MKNLAFIVVATILLSSLSCSTSSDDPTPDPVVDYTIKYSVVSTGDNVVVDTIMYMDADGVEKYVFGEKNFEHSFVKLSNNYHAKFYISGKVTNGSCEYGLLILDKDNNIQKGSLTKTTLDAEVGIHFSLGSEFSSSN